MTENNDAKIGGILLAAGGSTRFGSPKQLCKFEGKTLIRRAAEALCGSRCSSVVAVLGAETRLSSAELSGLDISIAINRDWQSGMSASIKTGVTELIANDAHLDAVLITLVDQPLVGLSDLSRLLDAYQSSGADIAAAQYNDTLGVPAVFARDLFERLLALKGDRGAKELIYGEHKLTSVALPNAAFDIDAPDDLRKKGS